MAEPIYTEKFKREADKEDPDGFANLEALTKKLTQLPKPDLDKVREDARCDSDGDSSQKGAE